jgi:hypothetical protein
LLGISWLRRKPAHFGMGTLLALILEAALPLAWMGGDVQNARRQSAIVQRIKSEGGDVWYRGFATRPQENTRFLGTDYFFEVGGLELKSSTHLNHLSLFPRLKSLSLTGTPTTVDDLRKLVVCRELEFLYLAETQVTDDGLKHLFGLPDLKIVAGIWEMIRPSLTERLKDRPTSRLLLTQRFLHDDGDR